MEWPSVNELDGLNLLELECLLQGCFECMRELKKKGEFDADLYAYRGEVWNEIRKRVNIETKSIMSDSIKLALEPVVSAEPLENLEKTLEPIVADQADIFRGEALTDCSHLLATLKEDFKEDLKVIETSVKL